MGAVEEKYVSSSCIQLNLDPWVIQPAVCSILWAGPTPNSEQCETNIAIQSKATGEKLFVQLTELYQALVLAFQRKLLPPSSGNKKRNMNSYFCDNLRVMELCDRGPGGLHRTNLFDSRCFDRETLERSKPDFILMVRTVSICLQQTYCFRNNHKTACFSLTGNVSLPLTPLQLSQNSTQSCQY